jgi:hypothetical protein
MADLGSGVAKFVAALGSRGRIREAAQEDAYGNLKKRAEGEIAADEFRSRGTLADDLIAAGVPANEANIITSQFRAGAGNFQQGTGGLRNLADLALQRDAVALANEENPDVARLNRLLASRNTGGGPLSPQQASVVPLGAALVEAAQAQAGQRNALADAALARAGASRAQSGVSGARVDLLNRTNPNIRVTKPGAILQTGPAPAGLPLGAELGAVDAIEQDLGATLTPQQRQQFTQTGAVSIPAKPAEVAAREQEGLQALNDARRAVQSGRISKEAARKRLYDAGFQNLAGRL